MGEGLFQPLHLLLIIAIALLVFGTSKFAAVGKGLGEGLKGFKDGIKNAGEPAATTQQQTAAPQPPKSDSTDAK